MALGSALASALALALASALALAGAAPLAAHAQEGPAAFGTMLFGGNYFRKGGPDSKYTIMATFIDRAVAMKGGDAPPAGMAAFGLFDSGEVMLLGNVDYLPSLAQPHLRREVRPAKMPVDPKSTPRYVMVCAWPLDDNKVPGKPTAAYAERDDANIQEKNSQVGTLLSVLWISVPVARVAKKFESKDYCGEVVKTGKSSAPLWLSTTKE
jgi:hypothetical protein